MQKLIREYVQLQSRIIMVETMAFTSLKFTRSASVLFLLLKRDPHNRPRRRNKGPALHGWHPIVGPECFPSPAAATIEFSTPASLFQNNAIIFCYYYFHSKEWFLVNGSAGSD